MNWYVFVCVSVFEVCVFCGVIRSFIFLFLENYGVRKLEAVFAVLIATMAISFAWMFGETKPDGVELLLGKYSVRVTFSSFFDSLFHLKILISLFWVIRPVSAET